MRVRVRPHFIAELITFLAAPANRRLGNQLRFNHSEKRSIVASTLTGNSMRNCGGAGELLNVTSTVSFQDTVCFNVNLFDNHVGCPFIKHDLEWLARCWLKDHPLFRTALATYQAQCALVFSERDAAVADQRRTVIPYLSIHSRVVVKLGVASSFNAVESSSQTNDHIACASKTISTNIVGHSHNIPPERFAFVFNEALISELRCSAGRDLWRPPLLFKETGQPGIEIPPDSIYGVQKQGPNNTLITSTLSTIILHSISKRWVPERFDKLK
ncbi:hypothetical protein ARMGADRAFT_1111026 [Armillaria gallica]|uniref:Uncharacterized protein n=1 Tax=Armillaria gallica TaxID=47427 RepID=A0A2H3DUH4_ARMGA|nr:hypothetical protein ARMGADRAFT_1111026 [Armillaria gallica]